MHEAHRNKVTFILGGVRSGKSRLAQQIAARASHVVFIATAKPSDEEMRSRIARHRQSRPEGWQTLEIPLDLDIAISNLSEEYLAIVDCLTVYLANVMSKAGGEESAIWEYVNRLYSALKDTKASILLVSNEVGSGVHPPTPLGRQYCDLLGGLNQAVAALADNVVLMVAGVPVTIKGQLPTEPKLRFHGEVPNALEKSSA